MPKVSNYELEHLDEEVSFEKVRKKPRSKDKETKNSKKENKRVKKIQI